MENTKFEIDDISITKTKIYETYKRFLIQIINCCDPDEYDHFQLQQ